MARNYEFDMYPHEESIKAPYESLTEAYEVARKLAFALGDTVNVWRECINNPDVSAMVGSVYRDGSIVGITPSDAVENLMCDYV